MLPMVSFLFADAEFCSSCFLFSFGKEADVKLLAVPEEAAAEVD